MIPTKEIYTPTKLKVNALTGTADSVPFDVGRQSIRGTSRVNHIYPETGETITEADSFELRRVLAVNASGVSTRSIKQYDKDGNALLLGATRTQFEVVIRGTYVLRKILDTTEDMGAGQTYGNDEGV